MADENFRRFTLSSGRVISAGKNAIQNDLLVSSASRKDTLLHTNKPGSPFVNLGENPTNDDVQEGCVYCASKSQDFRDNGSDVKVNIFLKDACYKDPSMSTGTWGVKKYLDTIKVSKIAILRMQHDIESELEEE